jgi:hypothetical protein
MCGDARTHCARTKNDCFFNRAFHDVPLEEIGAKLEVTKPASRKQTGKAQE